MCGLATGLALWSFPGRVEACGPCVGPEIWSIQDLKGEFVVVSNFGLLTQSSSGWHLTCEEAIGGLLLSVSGNAEQNFVSTDSGLFRQTGDSCEWSPDAQSTSNTWFLDFSLPSVLEGSASSSYILIADRSTSALLVQRSDDGADFTTVHELDPDVNFRTLSTGGEPASVFVSGYDNETRAWHIAFSLDGGDSWDDAVPDVDTEYTTMVLRLVDPRHPNAVYVEAQTVLGEPDEVWRFDAETSEIELILQLEDDELLSDLELAQDDLWVAGRRRGAGSLYRADRDQREFSRVVDAGLEFGCVAAEDDALYVCVNDFTYQSDFIVGRSTDQGHSWEPIMTVEDLGTVSSCGMACSTTTDWLQGAYGIGPTDAGASGSDTEIDGSAGDTPNKASATPRRNQDHDANEDGAHSNSSSGCQMTSGRTSSTGAWWALVALAALVRRRRPAKLASVAMLLAYIGSMGCAATEEDNDNHDDSLSNKAEHEGGASGHAETDAAVAMHDMAAAADCGDRGVSLDGLELETDGTQLAMLEFSPDPAVVGDNSWLIELTDEEGQSLTDIASSIFVTPFMPDHGHGTPVEVGVTEEDEGQYLLAPVNTFMPGLWQITVDVELESSAAQFQFSVCVQ
jgi:MYXO-CTERM domain-containing protein